MVEFRTSQKFNPNCLLDISKNINSKLNAMMCYKNEITNKHPRSLEAIKHIVYTMDQL